MFFRKKRSLWKFYTLALLLTGVITGSKYFSGAQAASKNNAQVLSEFDTKLKESLEKNPSIVIDVIAKNYELFTRTIQEGMLKAEKEMTKKIEGNITNKGKKMLRLGWVFVDGKGVRADQYQGKDIRLAMFFDPLCPHCHKLSDMLPGFLEQAKKAGLNVAVNLIPVGVLDEKNSKALSRVFLAVAQVKGLEKAWELLKSVIEDVMKEATQKKTAPVFTRDIILQHGKKLQIDMKAVEKLELETGPHSPSQVVEEGTKIFTQTGYPGVPILVGRHKDDKFSIISINSPDDFTNVVSLLKHSKEDAEKMIKAHPTSQETK